ncbi:hypothetical protein CO045_03610 [Candidatus Peregrinibacteria bacterium CG_4_9_14_0_2_um_filter_41_14]|nr:MAG: hypothetical protein COY06_04695 [Candidatus Peregrinibacteria bacterium CG_4_10_14_0_2_um_filter_41_8]PJC37800.1 MAG: hypothetical protein CO045_03610 [Candidatus Peregrinibacteria bacterium CG_4_9_14_0_2_um_filter_41_14]
MEHKYIFWDNDGTLVDTEPLYFDATTQALASVGVEFTREFYLTEVLEHGRSPFFAAEQKGMSKAEVVALREHRDRIYVSLLAQKPVIILPGVKEILTKLHNRYPMAIVTSSTRSNLDLMMNSSGLGHYFDFFVTYDDIKKAKPDPEPYLLAAQKANQPPSACLVIEDTERGVVSAKKAGMTCYLIPNQYQAAQTLADKVLASCTDLEQLISF